MFDSKHRIAFLTREGCTGTPLMRARLLEAMLRKGLPEAFQIIDMDQVNEDDMRTGYGTPTVLIDGVDLMGAPKPAKPAVPS